jgi:hypothetical protein
VVRRLMMTLMLLLLLPFHPAAQAKRPDRQTYYKQQ